MRGLSSDYIHVKDHLMPAKWVYWLLLSCVTLGTSCSTSMPYVWVRDFPLKEQVRRIQSGDTLGVAVQGQADLTGSYVVRENGTVLQPLLGEILVDGLTEVEAAKRFVTMLKGVVIKPKVSVTILKPRPVRIAVTGEVKSPGNFIVEYDETLLSVIARSGGLTPYADRSGIYVLRKRPELVRIRFTYDDLKGGELASSTFELHDNDVIVIE